MRPLPTLAETMIQIFRPQATIIFQLPTLLMKCYEWMYVSRSLTTSELNVNLNASNKLVSPIYSELVPRTRTGSKQRLNGNATRMASSWTVPFLSLRIESLQFSRFTEMWDENWTHQINHFWPTILHPALHLWMIFVVKQEMSCQSLLVRRLGIKSPIVSKV